MHTKQRVLVLISGGGTNLQALIDAAKEGAFPQGELVGVISNNPHAKGLERAALAGLPGKCVSPRDFKDRESFHLALLAAVDDFSPDLIVLAGFLVRIPEQMIHKYENRMINVHPSLIPSFSGVGMYGLVVHQKALERGVKLTGATVHFVTAGMDEGPIISQRAVAIELGDTPEILQRRVMEQAEWILLPQAVADITAGRITIENGKVNRAV
jgi:phosphoribosylglycinamide formyltransferase-1